MVRRQRRAWLDAGGVMKRGAPMPRATTPLRRYKPLAQVSAKKLAATQTPAGGLPPVLTRSRGKSSRILPDAVTVVKERSGGVCEIQLEGCWGRAVERSHRVTRGAGGCHGLAKARSDRPSDLLDSCTWCHLVITRHPWKVDARGNGWVLERWQQPTAEPVLYRGDLVYLDDAGGVHNYETAGA